MICLFVIIFHVFYVILFRMWISFVRIYVCAIYVCLCEFHHALFAWSQSRFICYKISILYMMIPEYVFISLCHPSVCLDGSDRTFGSDRTLLACSQSLLMYDQYRYCMKYSSVHIYMYMTSICMISYIRSRVICWLAVTYIYVYKIFSPYQNLIWHLYCICRQSIVCVYVYMQMYL